MVPGQLRIRQILNYYIPAILLLFVLDITYYNFNDEFFVIKEDLNAKNAIVAFAVLYVIGYLLNISYGILIAYNKGFFKGIVLGVFRIFIGRKEIKNKINFYDENKSLIDRKITLLLQITNEELRSIKPTELFNIVAEFVVNKSSDKSVDELGMHIINSYFCLKLSFVFLISEFIILALVILNLFNIGYIGLCNLLISLLILVMAQRISWTLFKASNDIWTGKIWRMIIAATKEDKK